MGRVTTGRLGSTPMLLVSLMAQAAIAAAPAATVAPQPGVISYPPAFFATFQPSNAMEMVSRVPGKGSIAHIRRTSAWAWPPPRRMRSLTAG